MKIKVAGAGAGKTTKMAKRIIDKQKKLLSHENIYCITFTNNAVETIGEKLINYFGTIPDNIKLSTIHSFLHQEIIKPYYYLLYNKQFTQISSIKLDSKPIPKNYKISQLEKENIIHVSKFSERAKWVIHKKSDDRKREKEIRLSILENFKNYCGHIFIDEAQDIDNNIVKILRRLDELSIGLELIGDPKQDLKGTKSLRLLIEQFESNVEYITTCYRCPQNHLDISNTIIKRDERQYSEKTYGTITLLFEVDIDIPSFFASTSFDLKYISKKNDRYSTTQKNNVGFQTLFYELTNMLQQSSNNTNELRIKQAAHYLTNKLISKYKENNDEKKTMKIVNKYINNDQKIYAKVISALKINNLNISGIPLSSIDGIKGQEGENCLFVLTTDLAAYLFLKNKTNNKTKNKLYVALTRSLDKLSILVTKEVDEKYGRKFILEFFEKFTL